MDRPTEISYFDISGDSKEKVLWLNISMNDFSRVTILQCFSELAHVLKETETRPFSSEFLLMV